MGNYSIPDEFIERVKELTDIVTLINEYVPLKRTGANYKALCPFHFEKTPSFIVSPQKQIYKCFGCGKAGNVYTFLMDFLDINFIEAVEILAKKHGLEIPKKEAPEEKEKKNILKVLEWATNFFQQNLNSREGIVAKRYIIEKRKIKEEYIKKFRIGYALNSWDRLLTEAKKQGLDLEILIKAGLVIKNRDRYYDRFRNRIIFPIWDIKERIIGFGGRLLIENPKEVKYLNTPETFFFAKGKNLYGLNFAKETLLNKEDNYLIITEGYTDVILAHQNNIPEAVATLGTSLTEEHVSLIKKYTNKVILVFDGDMAGRKAIERASINFLKKGMITKIVILPYDLDLCDFLIKEGEESFKNLINNAKDFWDYKIRELYNFYKPKTISEIIHIIKKLFEYVKYVNDKELQKIIKQEIAKKFKIPLSILEEDESKLPIKFSNKVKLNMYKKNIVEEDEKFIIWCLLHFFNIPLITNFIIENCEEVTFENPDYKEIIEVIKKNIEKNLKGDISYICSYLDSNLSQIVVNIYYTNYIKENDSLKREEIVLEKLNYVFKALRNRRIKQKIKEYKRKIMEVDENDYELKYKLYTKIIELKRMLNY